MRLHDVRSHYFCSQCFTVNSVHQIITSSRCALFRCRRQEGRTLFSSTSANTDSCIFLLLRCCIMIRKDWLVCWRDLVLRLLTTQMRSKRLTSKNRRLTSKGALLTSKGESLFVSTEAPFACQKIFAGLNGKSLVKITSIPFAGIGWHQGLWTRRPECL